MRERIRRSVLFFFFHSFILRSGADLNRSDESTFFDRSIPEFETALTPADFAAFSEASTLSFADGRPLTEEDLWDSDAMYNSDKFEGDIANDLNASTVHIFMNGGPILNGTDDDRQLNALRDRRQLWKDGRIPYAISSQYSSYSRSVIAASMQEYEAHTCIKWTPRLASDKDYVYIMPDRGCYSMVGRTGGRQTLSLGNGCIQKGIIIHEMMHAVGFFHEQSRSDRDEFISILWNNIQPGMQGQFEKYSPITIQTLGADYDFASIMHYGPKAFSRNGMPTIVPKRKATIGQRAGFSRVDSFKINSLYDCPNGGTPTTTAAPSATAPPPISVVIPSQPNVVLPIVMPFGPVTEPPLVISTLPPELPLVPAENCTDSRPDCDQLASQGWCTRNPMWMHDNCPRPCGMCEKPTATTTAAPTASGLSTTTMASPMPSNGSCEDLRVDCPELVKRRYCITAQTFSRAFCARSCGFCFAPPVTDAPASEITPTMTPPSTAAPPSTRQCHDRKHFCPHWKSAGFCGGMFQSYMKANCPASCGYC